MDIAESVNEMERFLEQVFAELRSESDNCLNVAVHSVEGGWVLQLAIETQDGKPLQHIRSPVSPDHARVLELFDCFSEYFAEFLAIDREGGLH